MYSNKIIKDLLPPHQLIKGNINIPYNNIGELFDTKLQETHEEVKNLDSKRNVSNRLSTYYENDIQWVNSAFYYIHIVYWILSTIDHYVYVYTLCF